MIRPTLLTTNFTSMHALALCAALSSGCDVAGTPHWTEPTESASGGDDGAAFERSVVREGSGHHSRGLAIGLGLGIGIPVTLGVLAAVALGALANAAANIGTGIASSHYSGGGGGGSFGFGTW
jgi:hypothetical protein